MCVTVCSRWVLSSTALHFLPHNLTQHVISPWHNEMYHRPFCPLISVFSFHRSPAMKATQSSENSVNTVEVCWDGGCFSFICLKNRGREGGEVVIKCLEFKMLLYIYIYLFWSIQSEVYNPPILWLIRLSRNVSPVISFFSKYKSSAFYFLPLLSSSLHKLMFSLAVKWAGRWWLWVSGSRRWHWESSAQAAGDRWQVMLPVS